VTEERKRMLLSWLPAIVWTGVIFSLSSMTVFASNIFRFHMIDKLAHSIEYGGLGVFLTVGYRGTFTDDRRRWVTPLVIVTGLAIGVCDELYQFTVPGRMVDFYDWCADSVGVILGNRLATEFFRWRIGGTEQREHIEQHEHNE